MITAELFDELKKITPEEQRILDGDASIQKEIYSSREKDRIQVVEASRLLAAGKLISIRPHTRFVPFPPHRHDYIEMVYMCHGRTVHRIDGERLELKEGELLLMNQGIVQEIEAAGEDDIAVNFIILPEFFDDTLRMMGNEENQLRSFIISCLKGENAEHFYMHFRVADVLPVQNLLENLIWSIHNDVTNKRSINQVTMGLLFLQLMNHMDRMETNSQSMDQRLAISVLSYIEENYRDGELGQLAAMLNYDDYWLSREIKRLIGRNYTDLVQERRLNQAAYLLETTEMSVMDIGLSVGYDNLSYFHRIFAKRYGTTPRKYRVQSRRTQEDTNPS